MRTKTVKLHRREEETRFHLLLPWDKLFESLAPGTEVGR